MILLSNRNIFNNIIYPDRKNKNLFKSINIHFRDSSCLKFNGKNYMNNGENIIFKILSDKNKKTLKKDELNSVPKITKKQINKKRKVNPLMSLILKIIEMKIEVIHI